MSKTGNRGSVDVTETRTSGTIHDDTLAWLATQHDLLHGPEGEWVALDDRRIVAHGPSVGDVVRQARANGADDPLLVPVPPPGYVVG